MSNPCILIIDDEMQIRKLLEITLKSNDYKVVEAACGREGLVKAANHPPDIILLDLGLPDMNGQLVLKELREWFANPIIILSVQSNEVEIITALDAGANDYLVKPFRTGELLARIRSALRCFNTDYNDSVIDCGNLQINLTLRTVKISKNVVKLTATEYSLLALLAKNESKVLTHTYLLNQIWGPTFSGETQYLRVFIAQLRKKIEANPNQPKVIITEPGVGYRFTGKD